MFVLRKRLLAWRAEMLARGVFSPGEVLELEDHVAEEASRLSVGGMTDDEAFFQAVRRLGRQEELVAEYTAAHRMSLRRRVMPLMWVFRELSYVCGIARLLVILVLPGMVVAVPGMALGALYSDMIERMFPGERLPVYFGLFRFCRYWPAAAIVVLVVLFLPAAYRAWQLKARDEFTFSGWFAEEARSIRPILPIALMFYPFVAYVAVAMFFGPLFRFIDWLAG